MTQLIIDTNDRQLALDFNATPARIENIVLNQANVISMSAYAQSRQLLITTPPVLERLLKEAQKLRW